MDREKGGSDNDPRSGKPKEQVMSNKQTVILLNRPEKHFLESFYYQKIKYGIDMALEGAGYEVLMSNQAVNLPELLKSPEHKTRGVLSIAPHVNHESVKVLEKAGVPTVLINCRSEHLSWVDVDNVRGAMTMTEHLISLGHDKILFLSGFPESQNSIDRHDGYRKALAKHGITLNPKLVMGCDFSITLSYERMKNFLAQKGRPEFTAVFASNDLMAVGAIRALTDENVRVPQDVAVVGFDDFDFSSSYFVPITTYRQPFHNVGYLAAKLLVRQIETRQENANQAELIGELVMRDSCGARL
jgi:DNA-binding LacI/PurR family transcriptional regulator